MTGVGACAGWLVAWDDAGSAARWRSEHAPFVAGHRFEAGEADGRAELDPPIVGVFEWRGQCVIRHGDQRISIWGEASVEQVVTSFPVTLATSDPRSEGNLVLVEGTRVRSMSTLSLDAAGRLVLPDVDAVPAPISLDLHAWPLVDVAQVDGGLLFAGDRPELVVVRPPSAAARLRSRGTIDAARVFALPGGRLLTLDAAGAQLERWTLVASDVPIPYPLGAIPLDPPVPDPLAAVALQDGAWLVSAGPVRRSDGLVVGYDGPGTPVAAASWWGPHADAAVVLSDGSVVLAQAPPLLASHAHSEPKRLEVLARALTEVATGVGAAAAHVRVRELLDQSSRIDRGALGIAGAYLERFPDPALSREVSTRWWTGWVAEVSWLLLAGVAAWGVRRRRDTTSEQDRLVGALHNPFRADSPNHPDRAPFGMDTLAKEILQTLDLNCVMLEGPQFWGKTALLRHLCWRLETEGLAGVPVRVAAVQLQGVTAADLWTRIGHAIARAYPSEPSDEILTLPEVDRPAIEYLLDEVLVEGAPRMVLVLDDLDALGLLQTDAQRLRGLVQVVPGHRMAVLAAGGSIRRGWSGHADESPWFNIFQVRRLEAMTKEQVRAWLERRVQAPFGLESGVADMVHRVTEGRPLQVWHVCFAATEQLLVEHRFVLTGGDVEEAAKEVRDLGFAFASDDDDAQSDWAWGLVDLSASWEQVIERVAVARRRRDELHAEVARRAAGGRG